MIEKIFPKQQVIEFAASRGVQCQNAAVPAAPGQKRAARKCFIRDMSPAADQLQQFFLLKGGDLLQRILLPGFLLCLPQFLCFFPDRDDLDPAGRCAAGGSGGSPAAARVLRTGQLLPGILQTLLKFPGVLSGVFPALLEFTLRLPDLL